MADKFLATYTCSYSPIVDDEYTIADKLTGNGTYRQNSIKSTSECHAIGGGMTIKSDGETTEGNVCGEDSIVTVTGGATLNALGQVAAGKNVQLLAIKILSADGANADADLDCLIALDGSNYEIKIKGKGACTVIPVNGISTSTIKYKSTAAANVCNVRIQLVHDA